MKRPIDPGPVDPFGLREGSNCERSQFPSKRKE